VQTTVEPDRRHLGHRRPGPRLRPVVRDRGQPQVREETVLREVVGGRRLDRGAGAARTRQPQAFRLACREAGLPLTLLPYDLRRSALRNMIRAGVDTSVAMKISGHRTRSTFDRYNVVDEQDVRAAIERTAAWAGSGQLVPKARETGDSRKRKP
jgi:hypothetical protein